MKAFPFVFWAVICLSCIAPAAPQGAPAKPLDLIADPRFELGFKVKDPEAQGRIVSWNHAAPVWEIVHHHSKSSFANESAFAFRPNGLTFKDDYGMLAVRPPDEAAELVMGVNAFKEFGGVYRKRGDPWPHLYLTQRIGNPGGHLGARDPSLADLARVDFSVSVRLLHDEPNKKPGFNPSIHAAQFVFFFTVQNLNRRSPGFGDYYWFGVLLYDSRKPVTALFSLQDKGSPLKKGTDKLIYDIGIAPFTQAVVGQGEWVTVKGDLLPHMIAGLDEAWKRGFLPASHERADYRIGMVVMGFEVTGLNDVSVAIKDLRAAATLKPGLRAKN